MNRRQFINFINNNFDDVITEVSEVQREDFTGYYLTNMEHEDFIDTIFEDDDYHVLPVLVGNYILTSSTEDARELADFFAKKALKGYVNSIQDIVDEANEQRSFDNHFNFEVNKYEASN